MAVGIWLIDKSALVRLSRSAHSIEWAERIDRGLVKITTVTLIEVGYSARSAADLRLASRRPPLSQMPVMHLTPAMERRAIEVQRLLADSGHHRGPGIPDLLIAAAAELTARTVLHVDKDFELISEITGQSVERLIIG